MTKDEIRKRWVAALRSGDYKQSTSRLRSNKGFCCLGVLCDIAVKEGVIPPPVSMLCGGYMYVYMYQGREGSLPTLVQEWAGVRTEQGDLDNTFVSLAQMNDDNLKSFEDIATIIESQPAGLFTYPKMLEEGV